MSPHSRGGLRYRIQWDPTDSGAALGQTWQRGPREQFTPLSEQSHQGSRTGARLLVSRCWGGRVLTPGG